MTDLLLSRMVLAVSTTTLLKSGRGFPSTTFSSTPCPDNIKRPPVSSLP